MSSCCGPSTSSSSCGTAETSSCGTDQVAANIACPKCRRWGVTSTNVTSANTLKREGVRLLAVAVVAVVRLLSGDRHFTAKASPL